MIANEYLETLHQIYDLFKYEKDWDDENGDPLNPTAYARTMKFLYHLISINPNLETPSISMDRTGGLIILWENKKEETKNVMVIIISDTKITWYGEEGQERNKTKSKTEEDTLELLNPELIHWINKNFTKK